jgi:hypothetical protein
VGFAGDDVISHLHYRKFAMVGQISGFAGARNAHARGQLGAQKKPGAG